MTRRRDGWRACALLGLMSLVVPACVGPSRTAADYEEKAANTAEAASSTVETVRLVVGAASSGRATSRYTSLVISEAEVDAGSIAEGFRRVQPPTERVDALREELSVLLDRCTATPARLRIASYRGDMAALQERAAELPSLTAHLARFTALRPT